MIIGLSGLAGSGKDTVANILAKKYSFVRIALADVIKRYCMELYDFSYDQLWGESKLRNLPDKRYPRLNHMFGGDGTCECCGESDGQCYLTPRYALQKFGGEGGRGAYEDVWVNYTMRTANTLLKNQTIYKPEIGIERAQLYWETTTIDIIPFVKGIVISDCRYYNELNAIKERNGKIVRIVRDGAGLKGAASNHSSESEQLEIPNSMFDYIIYNNNSFESLLSEIDLMYLSLLKGH